MKTVEFRNENGKTYLWWSLADHDARAKGKREGRLEGLAEGKLESARNLIAMGLGTYEQIAQAVELPLESIEELAKQV